MGPADDAAHEKVNARIDKMIAALETARDLTSDEDVQAQLDAAISGLEELRTAVDGSGISQVQDELLATVAKVRQTLRTAAVSTNRQVSDYIHDAGERAQSSLRAVQDLLTAPPVRWAASPTRCAPIPALWPQLSPRLPPVPRWRRVSPAIWPIWRRTSAAWRTAPPFSGSWS